MKKDSFLVRLIINALAFLIVSSIYSGMTVTGFWAAVIAALIWGVINALLKPLLFLLTLPINVLTFGLFTFVINGVILLLTSALYSGLVIGGFWAGILAAILLSVVNIILSVLLVGKED
ncbi:phage holin family protein [candidate division KSB3 bacterium]|uniref:Phage holin family protein n=1 Tax=candidate division KSB3 bacterium TaxID=2044937 RepID=A0A9D5Q7A4_9BACT|nr:phage holin family protein [candidate division KSB3 bacterium]MBD3325666.1 phage holin family protein [candidate division KSB3 bacterium]